MIPKKYLTVYEIARELNISTRAVMDIVRRGDLRALRVGSEIRVHPQDFRDFVKRSRIAQPIERIVV